MEVGIKVKRLAIYIHIPFCRQKCKYCDFNSFYIENELKIQEYIDSLSKEIDYYSSRAENFSVSSVYFGGGTPSFIDEKYIESIIRRIKSRYNILKDVEITIEVNPGTVDFNKLTRYKAFGINRVSIGVQTLNDNLLKDIGRIHTSKEAIDCYNLVRKAGFSNISLDIMFGLPNQSLKDVENTVDNFIKLNPEHISAYSLKVEEGTVFGRLYNENKLELPSEDTERNMYYLIKKKLKEAGYNQYEISNFSKEEFESNHNLAYWLRKDYLGFGLSASSCFNETRTTNTGNFLEYIKNPIENFSEKEVLSEDVIKSEKIILGLRLLRGIKEDTFIGEEKKKLEKLISKGLLIRDEGNIRLTDFGLDLANQVFVEFI